MEGTFIIGLIVIAIIALSIWSIVKNHKKGKSFGCDCSSNSCNGCTGRTNSRIE